MKTKLITSIVTQKKNPKRVNVFLEGEFGFGLSKLLAMRLKVDQEISDKEIEELKIDDQLDKAVQSALHFISYRPRSTAEVRKNLEGKEIAEDVIEKVITRLEDNSILNDWTFAEEWVNNRGEFRPRSRFALRMELRKKGVSEGIIETVLENIDEDALAYKAGMKYSHRLERLERPMFRKKLSSFLARRGFGYRTINPVVDSIWDKTQESIQGNTIYDKENS